MHLTLQKCGKCLSIFYRSRIWRRLRKVKVLIYTDCSGSIDFLFECLPRWAFNWHPLPWSFSACLNSHGSSAGKAGVVRKIEVNIPCWCPVPACFAPWGWCLSTLGVLRRQQWECSGLCLQVGHPAMLRGEGPCTNWLKWGRQKRVVQEFIGSCLAEGRVSLWFVLT